MVRRWTPGGLSTARAPVWIEHHRLSVVHADELGRLLWSAFGSAGTDGFDSADAALGESHATLRGKWGPMIWDASVLATADQTAVAASVVVRDDAHAMLPLLAFLVTDPEYQRRGVGRAVLAETLRRMDVLGITQLHLAVGTDNDARQLYEQMGFSVDPS